MCSQKRDVTFLFVPNFSHLVCFQTELLLARLPADTKISPLSPPSHQQHGTSLAVSPRFMSCHVMSCHVIHIMLCCHVLLTPRFNWRQLENVMEGVTEEQLLTQVRPTCMLVGIRGHLVGSCFSCPSCSLRSATARPSRSGSWLARRASTWGCHCEAR